MKAFTSDKEQRGTCGKESAVWHCQECDYVMCEDCKMHHLRMLLNKDHKVASLEETKGLQFVVNSQLCVMYTLISLLNITALFAKR